MEYFLLSGVVLNFAGSFRLLAQAHTEQGDQLIMGEHIQLKFFVAGVAFTFGCVYLYLFFRPEFIFPFLLFGAGLKSWAFVTCLYLYSKKRISKSLFVDFGVLNGVVALLFAILLVHT